MPQPTIDYAEIATGLAAFAADREAADRAARTEQQRLLAVATAEQARRHHESDLAELHALEAAEANMRAGLADREKQMATLYSEILELRTRFNSCLGELERKRRTLGL